MQLRSRIQASLSQMAHEQGASPPPPLNANPRIRSSDEVGCGASINLPHGWHPCSATAPTLHTDANMTLLVPLPTSMQRKRFCLSVFM